MVGDQAFDRSLGRAAGVPFYSDPNDNLRTPRGVIFGVLLGLAFWATFIWTVFPA